MSAPGPLLIVDDEPDVRNTLAIALTDGGYEAVPVAGAAEALAALGARPYPVVITDLHMPGLSGLDLMSEIRARHPKTLCIVITGFASLETATESLKRGAHDFIQKPFKIGQIEATVNRALELARAREQVEAYQHRLEEMVVARTAEIRALHQEVVALNDLLIEAQDQPDLEGRLRPFLEHLHGRFGPEESAILVPGVEGWQVAARLGGPTWTLQELRPRLDRVEGIVHLTAGLGQLEEGFLLPLDRNSHRLGIVVAGFRRRSAFLPRDPQVDLWSRQLEAVLLGWHHIHGGGATLGA